MPRFYADENFPLPVIAELRRLARDVFTMVEMDHAGRALSDERLLAFARIEKRALLTLESQVLYPFARLELGTYRHDRLHVRPTSGLLLDAERTERDHRRLQPVYVPLRCVPPPPGRYR